MGTEVHSKQRETSSASREQPSFRQQLRAIAVAICLTVFGVLFGIILGSVGVLAALIATDVSLSTFSATDPLSTSAIVASTVGTELAYLCIGGLYVHRWLIGVRATVRRPTRREVGWIVGGTVVAVTGAVVGPLLAPTDLQNVSTELSKSVTPSTAVLLAGLSVLLIGPAEELLFRGAIQGRLRRTFGPAASILVTSVLFTSAHILGRTGPLSGVLVSLGIIFTLSLVTGIAYERTENLTVNILIHGLYNAVLFAVVSVSSIG